MPLQVKVIQAGPEREAPCEPLALQLPAPAAAPEQQEQALQELRQVLSTGILRNARSLGLCGPEGAPPVFPSAMRALQVRERGRGGGLSWARA